MALNNLLRLVSLLAFVPVLLSHTSRRQNLLQIIHEWKFVNFAYNSQQDRSIAEKLGYLTPGNVVILDADYYIDPSTSQKRIFVTSPQFLTGTPATVSEVRDGRREEPLMSPYPSWDAQNTGSCRGPVSVYRIFIDKCGLLWILDSGMVETFNVPRRACQPKVLIYDLNKNDELVARYEFPDGVVTPQSILITLITESYQNDCRDSIAYISDVNARGLVVFDFPNKKSWRVQNSYFHPFPDRALFHVNGVKFELMDGLFGLTLSPPNDNARKLYFHSAASVRESWVPTWVLRNSTIAEDTETLRREFHHSEDIREGQCTVEVMTDDGILIYPVLSRNALACWNSAQPLRKEFQYIIYEDQENLQFISGMKLKNKTLMITSSRLQNYILLKANGTDIKYRVMIIDNIDKLLDGTPCRNNEKIRTNPIPGYGGQSQSSQTSYTPSIGSHSHVTHRGFFHGHSWPSTPEHLPHTQSTHGYTPQEQPPHKQPPYEQIAHTQPSHEQTVPNITSSWHEQTTNQPPFHPYPNHRPLGQENFPNARPHEHPFHKEPPNKYPQQSHRPSSDEKPNQESSYEKIPHRLSDAHKQINQEFNHKSPWHRPRL